MAWLMGAKAEPKRQYARVWVVKADYDETPVRSIEYTTISGKVATLTINEWRSLPKLGEKYQ